MKKLPEQQYLKECLSYDPDTGSLTWKSRPLNHFKNEAGQNIWNAKFSGKPAFLTKDSGGYLMGRIDGKRYRAHRIIYKIMTGEEPKLVDHDDRVRDNNAWKNLGNVSVRGNALNRELHHKNKTGYPGVNPVGKKFRADISHGGQQLYLGTFPTLGDAIAARRAAESQYGYKHHALPS